MTELFELAGKTAVVSGGAGLLGRAVSEGLVDQGATVVVADVDAEACEEVASDLGSRGHPLPVDITSDPAVHRLVATVAEEFDALDVFVNAAYPRNERYGMRYEDVTAADWRENVDLHLNAYFQAAYRVSLEMKSQPNGGSIVNFGSIYGIRAPDFTVYEGTDLTSPVEYVAIKSGILNLTRYMASYLGEHGVRVNTVSPGGVFDDQDPRFVKQYEARTPLRRIATPEDVVGAVVYLASDAAAYVTGHNLVVDGEWTIH